MILNFVQVSSNTNIQASDIKSLIYKKFLRLKNSAKSRGIEFKLSLDDVGKLLMQDTCFFTGKKFSSGNLTCLSIDRIDNNIGYLPGNVVSCNQDLNSRKSNITIQEIKQIYIKTKYSFFYKLFFKRDRNISDIEISRSYIGFMDSNRDNGIPCFVTFKGWKKIFTIKQCYFTGVQFNGNKKVVVLDKNKPITDKNIVLCSSDISIKRDRLSMEELKMILDAYNRNKKNILK